MATFVTFTVLLLVGIASTAPVNDDILHISEGLFPEEFAIYTAENDITKITIPLNALNFADESSKEDSLPNIDDTLIFFIEKGKGVYSLKKKTATKVLENGNDIAASSDDNKLVFFAATDGLYTYNDETKKADKYGTLTDNIIGLAVANGTDEIYILTNDHVVYKVSEEGTKKEEVSNVKDATQIVLDTSNNLYYVDDKKHVYVRLHEDGTVKSIKGLPARPNSVLLLSPPVVLDDSVPVIAGKKAFLAYANGTAEFSDLVFDTKPTAFSVEATLLLFAAHNKTIYEYNLLNIVVAGLIQEGVLREFEDVQKFFSDSTSEIQTMATRPINSIRA